MDDDRPVTVAEMIQVLRWLIVGKVWTGEERWRREIVLEAIIKRLG